MIFRVPEYSELSIRVDARSRSNQERSVSELGIFLPANLAAAVEVYCPSARFKSFEGTRICVAAGPEIKNGRRNESQKAHLSA
jgi:hypothetical protein